MQDESFELQPSSPSQEEERRAKIRAYKKAWREANKEDQSALKKAWYQANKEHVGGIHKAYREANKEELRVKKKAYRDANKEKVKARKQAHYQANKERIIAATQAYKEANRERTRANANSYYQANKARLRARQTGYILKNQYGLSLEDFDAMRAAQNDRCRCCNVPFGLLDKTRPCVDHCHETGKVRGLLCRRCNLTIGHAHDDPRVLRKCAAYLEKSKKASQDAS